MNKTELIAAVAEKTGLTKKDAERVINAAVDTITASLVKGDKVQLSGFGIFEVKPVSAATPAPSRPSRSPLPACPPSRQAKL